MHPSTSRPLVAVLFAATAWSTAWAADVRGTLQGADTLSPSDRSPPATTRARGSYWEVPNGVMPVSNPRAAVDWDLGVIVTGEHIPESAQRVTLRIEGGRCRPGTVVVRPGTVLVLDNNDVVGHALFAVAAGQTTPTVPAELTSSRTRREVTFTAPGVFELRDERQTSFRCWIVVGPEQGRVVPVRPDGTFTLAGLEDGDYTVRAWFEGTERANAPLHVAGREVPLALPLTAPGGARPPGAPPAAPPTR